MARVTVEDCAEVVPSRFELVALAAQRARLLTDGLQPTLPRNNDKDAVIALREIAEETIDIEEMREMLISNNQEKTSKDEYGVDAISSKDAQEAGFEATEVHDELASLGGVGDAALANPDDSLEEALGSADSVYGDDNLDVDD
jgi:DNA-directed RNA polymerase subunit omega